MKTRAFVLEPASQSVHTAREYGEITYIFQKGEKRSSIWSEEFKQELLDCLEAQQFNPKVDCFVVTGHLVPLTIAVTTILIKYGCLQVLFYSATERQYVLRKIENEKDISCNVSDCARCVQ